MNNLIFLNLLNIINDDIDTFNSLVLYDNALGLGVTTDDITNYLEFDNSDSNILSQNIESNIIITEGNVLSILKIIHDLANYEGDYILYINTENMAINTYLITKVNYIYKELELNVHIILDYSDNYNKYLNNKVTLIGSNDFINTACKDFQEFQLIEV